MHDLLQDAAHEYDTPEFWIALESLRDLVELGFIFEQLGEHVASPKFRAIIKNLLDDKPLPQDDRSTNSKGRNAHWELYLAAICKSAAMVPIGFDGNDVTCTVEGTQLGIEAKRIKSEDKADKRIKKAIDSLSRPMPGSGRGGYFAGVERAEPSRYWVVHNALIDMKLEAQTRQFFDRHKAWIEERSTGKGVLAVVVFNFMMRLREDKWCPHRHSMWFDLPQTQNEYESTSHSTTVLLLTPNRKDTIDGT